MFTIFITAFIIFLRKNRCIPKNFIQTIRAAKFFLVTIILKIEGVAVEEISIHYELEGFILNGVAEIYGNRHGLHGFFGLGATPCRGWWQSHYDEEDYTPVEIDDGYEDEEEEEDPYENIDPHDYFDIDEDGELMSILKF